MQLLYGILIGVGSSGLIALLVWMAWMNTRLRTEMQKMQKLMRKRLPYDAQKYGENTAAALVLLRQDLQIKLDEVDNAIAWNTKLLNIGIKSQREEEER